MVQRYQKYTSDKISVKCYGINILMGLFVRHLDVGNYWMFSFPWGVFLTQLILVFII